MKMYVNQFRAILKEWFNDGYSNEEILHMLDNFDDHYDYDNDYDNNYSYSEQRSADVLDYTRQQYESGKISYEQMQEMRIGA